MKSFIITNKILFSLIVFFIKIFCFSQENLLIKDISSDFSSLILDIIKDNNIIQKINYEYPDECFEDAVFVENKFDVIDVNFDGFKDILIYLGSYGNQGIIYKDCFVWNESTQNFVNNNILKTIPNIQIDTNEECIYGSIRNQSSHFIYEKYSWNKDNLVLNYEIHKFFSAEQLNDIYHLHIPDNRDSGEYIMKHFKINEELYESIFFVETIYLNGKISISDPSIKLCDEIPEKLRNLINK